MSVSDARLNLPAWQAAQTFELENVDITTASIDSVDPGNRAGTGSCMH